jgi:hypothetical protein
MNTYQNRKEYFRKWERKQKRHKDPVRIARAKAWAKANPERIVEIMRKHNYGISSEEYNSKKKKQRNRCALCGNKEHRISHHTGKRQTLSVDHDHKTDKVRDLLCGNCNRGLGLFFDNVKTLIKAVQYLRRHKGVSNGR